MSDFVVQGIYIPRLFVFAFIAVIFTLMLRFILIRAQMMTFIWHPSLFESAIFVVLLQLLSSMAFGR